MRFFRISMVAIALAAVSGAARAQSVKGSDQQTLAITVSSIDNITLGADPTGITLASTNAGTASSSVSYSTNDTTARKIAVKVDVVTSGLTVTVTPTVTSGVGTAVSGAVELTTSDQDLITDITAGSGTADLAYSAQASLSVPPGNYSKTVTYTLLAP